MMRELSFGRNWVDPMELTGQVTSTPFPRINPKGTPASVIQGNLAVALTDRRATRETMKFLASPRFGRKWLAQSQSWVMPNLRFDLDAYSLPDTRHDAAVVHVAIEADSARFDGSDQMGGDPWLAFNTGIIRYLEAGGELAGTELDEELDRILADIDASFSAP